MHEILIPSLWIVAGVCLYAGFSHLTLAIQRRAVIHLIFGLMCCLLCATAVGDVLMHRSTTSVEHNHAVKLQVAAIDLWGILLVWFVALYTAHRPVRFLCAHNALGILVFILNLSLPHTLFFTDLAGESQALAWLDTLLFSAFAGESKTLALLGYLPFALAYGFSYVCCYRQFRQGMRTTALYLGGATSTMVASTVHYALMDFGGLQSFGTVEFTFLFFILVMTFRLGDEMEAANRAFQESEERFRTVFETSGVGIVLGGPDGEYLEVNPAYCRFLGYDEEKLLGMTIEEVTHPEDREATRHQLERCRSGQDHTFELEKRYLRSDGETIWANVTVAWRYVGESNRRLCVGVIQDITERKRAEEALRESEERYRLLADYGADWVSLLHVDGRRLYVSPSYFRATGWTTEDLDTTNWRALTHPNDAAGIDAVYAANLRGESTGLEHRTLCKDGSYLWVESRGKPVVEADGQVQKIVVWTRDISARKRTEEQLQESEERYRLLADYSADFVSLHEADGRPLYVSPSFFRATGWTPEDLDTEGWRTRVHPDDIEMAERAIEPNRRGETTRQEYRILCKDGTSIWLERRAQPVIDEDGQIEKVVGWARDITERKQAEYALQESQERLELAQVAAHVGCFEWHLETNTAYYTHECFRLFGLEPSDDTPSFDEWNGRVHPNDRAAAADKARQAVETTEPYDDEYRVVWPDGSIHWLAARGRMFRDESDKPVRMLGVISDITARKQAEVVLQDREQRLRAILNTAVDAIVTTDQRGIINGVNPATDQMFGYAQGELIGQNVKALMPPPYCDEHDNYLARYFETGVPRTIGAGREAEARRKDGSTFPVGLAISEVKELGIFTGFVRDISDRKKLERDVLRIAEEEQQRIAQDLHDGTQQGLAGLGLLAQTLALKLSQGNGDGNDSQAMELCELATKVVDGIARTHQEVRAVSRGLAAVGLTPQGLMDALRELASRTDNLEGITCAFKCEQPVEIADSLTATHLYRIAQEAIANALKHGQPEHILIALESNNGQLTLQVADDGSGFETAQENEGVGLKTMRYRSSVIGGSTTVSPVDSGGTLVTCRVSEGEIR